jgi:hypothetical protein
MHFKKATLDEASGPVERDTVKMLRLLALDERDQRLELDGRPADEHCFRLALAEYWPASAPVSFFYLRDRFFLFVQFFLFYFNYLFYKIFFKCSFFKLPFFLKFF